MQVPRWMKSCKVNFSKIFSIAQILANASPNAIVTEVEHVGAKFNGHASLSTAAFK